MSANEERRGPEPWAWAGFVVAGVYLGLLLYLGSRPGGHGAIRAWTLGPRLCGLSAFAIGVFGLGWSVWRRPFLQRRRLPALLAVGTVCALAPFPMPYPSSHAKRTSAVELELPVEGEWVVRFGGARFFDNPLVILADRCTALHLVQAPEGASLRAGGEPDVASDYLCFGAEILAPAAGQVVVAIDSEPDLAPSERRGASFPGNHVVLEIAPGEFLFLAGLQQGSVAVRAGDGVEVGAPLARVGSSGGAQFTAEPHLGMHLQDTPEPYWGEGIPWRLHRYRVGDREQRRGLPRGGLGPGGALLGERISRTP